MMVKVKSILHIVTASAFLLLTAVPAFSQEARIALTEEMVNSTATFLQSLSSEQSSKATYTFDDEERLNWHFIPRPRNGLSINDLDEQQRQLVSNLMQTFLSARGYGKVEQIRSLELVLAEIEQNGRFVRDPDAYFVTVFGNPTMTGTWAFRFEGHHIALNWTFVQGNGIASSPQFFGSNPAEVRSGPKTGLRVLGTEEDLARQLVTSLSPSQQEQAIIAGMAPRDIFTAAEKEISALEDTGISYGDLGTEQQELLMALIEEVAGAQPGAIADERVQQIRNSGTGEIKFTWIGGTARGDAHYYRIQGVGFLIEYDNTQNDANHVHLVWRDFNGDFGRDLIRLHYDAVAVENGPGHHH